MLVWRLLSIGLIGVRILAQQQLGLTSHGGKSQLPRSEIQLLEGIPFGGIHHLEVSTICQENLNYWRVSHFFWV